MDILHNKVPNFACTLRPFNRPSVQCMPCTVHARIQELYLLTYRNCKCSLIGNVFAHLQELYMLTYRNCACSLTGTVHALTKNAHNKQITPDSACDWHRWAIHIINTYCNIHLVWYNRKCWGAQGGFAFIFKTVSLTGIYFALYRTTAAAN